MKTSFRGKKLAKKYYDKLYKEYCICDLSRYKENKVNFTILNLKFFYFVGRNLKHMGNCYWL